VASEFKIFYSWQSDLPGNITRNFIEDVIKAAAKYLANTVAVIPDRDTRGEMGSPNIETTIFNKIDECDLFIADLSIVGSYQDSSGHTKYMPNPNVLIELGYAVKVLSWERVICFVNTDYGKEAELPFDLNHHRVTGYSLQDKEKAEVRRDLRDIISSTVITLLENGPRIKEGFAGHIVGNYLFDEKIVVRELSPMKIEKNPFIEQYKKNVLSEIEKLIQSISSKRVPEIERKVESTNDENLKLDLFNWAKVKFNAEDVSVLKEDVLHYLNIELDDDFFELGDLERQSLTIMGMAPSYRGSEVAKEKYFQINKCIGLIGKITLLEAYIETFSYLVAIPLAIWNNTTVTDDDISISICIDGDSADVIEPNENMINPEISEIAGLVYEQHYIEKLFDFPENADIRKEYELQMPNTAEIRAQFARINSNPLFGYSEPTYDIDDYVKEIRKYIAEPINQGGKEFDFYVKKLRPNEKVWLGKYIILKPKQDEIKLSYKITSGNTDGSLAGELFGKIEAGNGNN
jgi:hypothetical protein